MRVILFDFIVFLDPNRLDKLASIAKCHPRRTISFRGLDLMRIRRFPSKNGLEGPQGQYPMKPRFFEKNFFRGRIEIK